MTIKESEADFLSWVIDCAHAHGWLVAHFRPAKTEKGWRTPVSADGKGFPDLVMVRGYRLIVSELKSQSGKADANQNKWLHAFNTVSLSPIEIPLKVEYRIPEVYTWRPSMREEIERILA